MRIADISLLGWIHTLVCIAALALGAMALVLRKGSRHHRRAGYGYVAAMIAANATALGLYVPIFGMPTFNRFHWMAIAAIVLVIAGAAAARRQRHAVAAYAHPLLMLASYELLVGALINEAFLRVGVLRDWAMTGAPSWARVAVQTPRVREVHTATLAFFALLALWAVFQVFRRRMRRAPEAVIAT